MTPRKRKLALKAASLLLPEEDRARLEILEKEWRRCDTGFGYDVFGAEWEYYVLFYAMSRLLYEKYFRVESFGHENIPSDGSFILAGNHSGGVPLDGVMIPLDLVKKLTPPRLVRAIVEIAFSKLPFSNYLMFRIGYVVGLKRNFEELLKAGQAVLVFPEGIRGMGKPIWKRYQLTPFNVGHVELSIENRAPIVPVGVVGAEEQMIIVDNWERVGRLFGVNAFPITLTWPWLGPLGLIPLPTKYRIYYGKPFRFWEEDPQALHKAEVVREMANRVQNSVQNLLNEGVKNRHGIFI